MILTEDQFALDQQLDCIIPFTCTYYCDQIKVGVYEALKDMAAEFIKKFNHNAFSDEAIGYIDSEISPFLMEWNYIRSEALYDWEYVYIIDHRSMINNAKIRSDTLKIENNNSYMNLTTINTALYFEEWGIEPVNYATVIDGKIVSIASENTHYLNNGECETAVETAKAYRGMGYAASNVAALAKHISEQDKRVWYKCSRYNVASQRTASAVGFRCAGKNYFYVAYRKED